MRRNIVPSRLRADDGKTYIVDDWYPHGIPSSVKLADNVYVDSSYGFAFVNSRQPGALFIDHASGCYDMVSFIIGDKGKVRIGKFCILNGCTIICNNEIQIGDHCMFAWGSLITDSWIGASANIETRSSKLLISAKDEHRRYPFHPSKPVVIGDNAWVGFDAVILPGVTVGKGSVVACKTIVGSDVPPYAVVAGSPAKIVRYLHPDDDEKAREEAMNEYLSKA